MTERTPRLPEGSAGPSPALEPMDAAALAAWHAGGAPELLAEPLPPSATAWLLHVLVARPPETLVCVADGPKTLDVLAQDVAALRSLAGVVAETAVFPAWESLPGHGPPPPPELTGDRLEALRRLAGPAPRVVLTCVQALMQRTVPPDFLAGRALRLAPGAHLERHDLTAFLEQAGYDFHVEVQSPGQAAVRGGIVDAWPPADPLPVRIELCGPEVESLRRFDPADQRSRGEIPSVELGPAGEPEEASASSFAEHVPPGAWWVWCDMRAIARHAEILDGAAREAGAEAAIVPAAQALAARPGDRHLRLGWPEEGGPAALAFGLRPVEGVPTLPGSAYRPDLVDEARARFVDLLAGRARDGWRIALFFASEGARDRFREVHGPKLAPFAGVSVHLGGRMRWSW